MVKDMKFNVCKNIMKSFKKAITLESEADFKPKFETAVAIILNKGQVLLGEATHEDDRKGKLCFPGGGMKGEENPYKAAVREAIEETGIISQPINMVPVVDSKKRKVCFIVCVYIGGELKPNYEFKSVNWYSVKDLPKEQMFEQNYIIMQMLMNILR